PGRRLMSTTRPGTTIPSLIQLRSSVPPAIGSAPGSAIAARTPARSFGRLKVKVSISSALPRRRGNRGPNLRIGRAAGEVAAHVLADLVGGAGVPFLDAGYAGHDLAGRAEAALKRIVLDEGGLQGMQRFTSGQAFDRGDLASVDKQCQRHAGEDAAAINM